MSAAEELSLALVALLEADGRPPCTVKGAPDPCSEDADEREACTYRCNRCPIRRQCSAFGDETKATFGVYGGSDRTRRPGRPKSAPLEEMTA